MIKKRQYWVRKGAEKEGNKMKEICAPNSMKQKGVAQDLLIQH